MDGAPPMPPVQYALVPWMSWIADICSARRLGGYEGGTRRLRTGVALETRSRAGRRVRSRHSHAAARLPDFRQLISSYAGATGVFDHCGIGVYSGECTAVYRPPSRALPAGGPDRAYPHLLIGGSRGGGAAQRYGER